MKRTLHRLSKWSLVVGGWAFLSACGGGNSQPTSPNRMVNQPDNGYVAGVYQDREELRHLCEAPRSGSDPTTGEVFPDQPGSSTDEKLWLRSWSHDTYLWYDELDDIDPAGYGVIEYFELLRTDALTPSGVPKDNFHFTQDTEEYNRQTQGGVSYSYGIEWKFGKLTSPGRELHIAYIESGSPAAQTELMRGARVLEIDGIDFVDDNTQAGVDAINAAIFPDSIGESHTFLFRLRDGSEQEVTLTATEVATQAVNQAKVLDTQAGKLGYLQFNTHIVAAQDQLIEAMEQFDTANVTDLVVDLRYNGGGLLAIASQLGYMVAGADMIQGQVFEQIMFNDKYPNTNPITGNTLQPTPFYDSVIDYDQSQLTDTPLPSLNLSRVFVLTTDSTCSASEAFINGLRGIGVEVVQIGDKTCGKPYGFYPTDNCGTTYFTIQFKGVNAQGFGEYADGFTPNPSPSLQTQIKGCPLGDDLSQDLGHTSEALLSGAITYLETGACPEPEPSVASMTEKAGALEEGLAIRARDPRRQAVIQENRLNQPISR
ncbi:hypothetical protein HMF8227_00593 [Saliniradius amylolyticus]|uniref:Tail specific protease domain-containing protein n=1 Tax=Saliniradius amylolyticus TaxID=2183582 RepID=A0A2S2E0G3_9ALTE|nr:S41 family peptidase [Saliniradius amylolyticus]AWL11089.1 hypothetical protein HMF8227_00593 [Saliniradius amylolyticus]